MAFSIVIARACQCLPSRPIFLPPRSAPAISRKPTRKVCSRSAATIASWSPAPTRCRERGDRDPPGDRQTRRFRDCDSRRRGFSRHRTRRRRTSVGLFPACRRRAAARRGERLAALLNDGPSDHAVWLRVPGAHDQLIALASDSRRPWSMRFEARSTSSGIILDVRMTGLIGFSSGYYAMLDCDVLLILGSDFPYRQFFPAGECASHKSISERELGRRAPVDLGVVGDVSATLDALLPLIGEKRDRRLLDQATRHYRNARKGLDDLAVGVRQAIDSSTRSRSPKRSTISRTRTPFSPATSVCRRCGPRVILR